MHIHKIYAKKIHRRISPERYNHAREVERWYRDGGDNHFRYTYRLGSRSTVIDAGGYEGEWSRGIYDKYHPRIYIFEPVKKYYDSISLKFKGNKKVRVFHAGLSGKDRQESISIDDVSSSVFKKGGKTERISLLDIQKFCREQKLKRIDLIKINIEGGEYELLERLIETGMAKNITNIQVQFHDFFPDAEKRMESIQRKLSRTHRLTYSYWFVWDNWELKQPSI